MHAFSLTQLARTDQLATFKASTRLTVPPVARFPLPHTAMASRALLQAVLRRPATGIVVARQMRSLHSLVAPVLGSASVTMPPAANTPLEPTVPVTVGQRAAAANAAKAASNHNLGDEMALADLAATPDSKVDAAPVADPFLSQPKEQVAFEIKDAELIFRQVWQNLVAKYGEENMVFPKEVMWLAGAPGAGKGAMTPIVKEYRGITAPPIEVGSLLTSPAALALKAQGKLVGDAQVIELLLESLLRPEYSTGVVVDGCPRTKEQAECIKLLFDHMQLLRSKYANTALASKFRRPIFHITVLYIDKEESVKRQMRRGQLALHHNEMVSNTGIGSPKPVRETDLSPTLAAERYKMFKEQVYESLKVVKSSFHFHFINAEGTPAEVQERIIAELSYQSSMELADETFEKVRRIPLASEVILAARHDLVRRLDHYRANKSDLFERVIAVITNEFLHIIRRQALSGRAIIRSQNDIFSEPLAIDMALDLLSERGYSITLDYNKVLVPSSVNLQTGEIINSVTKVFEFVIEFPKPTIRRG